MQRKSTKAIQQWQKRIWEEESLFPILKNVLEEAFQVTMETYLDAETGAIENK